MNIKDAKWHFLMRGINIGFNSGERSTLVLLRALGRCGFRVRDALDALGRGCVRHDCSLPLPFLPVTLPAWGLGCLALPLSSRPVQLYGYLGLGAAAGGDLVASDFFAAGARHRAFGSPRRNPGRVAASH